MHACQVHQCLHGQIRLQQSDPLQAYTHCATKSLASAVKPTKRPLLSGACGKMTLQKLRSQIPITPENMQEERNLISLCKSTVGKVAACLFYGIFFDFFWATSAVVLGIWANYSKPKPELSEQCKKTLVG